ncbi:MAG: DinB family protein [Anaerolineae bacterium]|jgi:hypothetical protein
MDLQFITTQMESNVTAIQALARGVSDEQARWRPGPDDWSLLEVINHLHDEEIEDFKAHLDLILHHPGEPWPAIDPQGWVTQRGYNQRDPASSLGHFLRAREASLRWLKELPAPDWQATYQAPFGPIRAGDMLAAWVAHDLLHLRQIVELHWTYTNRQVRPYGTRYAGPWQPEPA